MESNEVDKMLMDWAFWRADYKQASRSVLHALIAFSCTSVNGRIRMMRKQIARLLRMHETHVSRLIKEMINLNILTKDDEGLRFSDEVIEEARGYQGGTYQIGTWGTKVVPLIPNWHPPKAPSLPLSLPP